MNYYRYKLITPAGEVTSGVARLPYKELLSAVNHLERDGSMTLSVSKLGRIAYGVLKLFDLRPRRRLPRTALAEILNNVALMLRAGMPLITALSETAQTDDYPGVGRELKEIIERIEGGASLSEAAQHHPHLFPPSVLYMIRMGEETGKLDQMLRDAAAHLKRIQAIISDTKQALLYPSFVMTSVGAGMLFWFAYVVPKIVGLFKELDVELPAMTRFLIRLSEFTQSFYLHLAAALIGGVLAVVMLRRYHRPFRKALDQILLRLPITRSIIHASLLAYISEYFAMLINAGIDILQSMRILRESVGNTVYSDKLAEVRASIELGEGVAQSFKASLLFPNFVVRMIHVGESSGTLPEQLNYIAEEYRNRLAILVSTIGKSIEPLILLVAGTIFAVIIIGLFLPIYDLVSTVSGI